MNADEYMKMQESAANRVRDMKRRADSFTSPSGAVHPNQPFPPSPQNKAEPAEPTHEVKPPEPPKETPALLKAFGGRGAELFKMLNFKGIEMDSDRALITGMMLLLLSESDDELLILALLYVML